MNTRTLCHAACALMVLLPSLVGCGSSLQSAASAVPQHVGESLRSLTKIDDYPVYTMHLVGPYGIPEELVSEDAWAPPPRFSSSWACSLFAALGDADSSLFGRSFDWEHSPMLLLYTNPEEGYATVTCVDFAYLIEDDPSVWDSLENQPLETLYPLLEAPYLPFNGMNEHELAIGMAAVAPDRYVSDAEKPLVGHLQLMRFLLEGARTAEEAVDLVRGVSITDQGGPHIHYLLADRQGGAALIEFVDGELVVHQNLEAWHVATNFTVARVNGTPIGQCLRYDLMTRTLEDARGNLSADQAMDLLHQVSQSNTQWSIVYDLSNLTIRMALGRDFNTIHTFDFSEIGVTLR
ncbi:linear amide C-N hydrolase [Candidatus Bipolaricaulota bacterium]